MERSNNFNKKKHSFNFNLFRRSYNIIDFEN
ncbi:hypothetical protein BH23BAC1_BH23BAC1_43060 [soil metagenome]